MSLAILLSFISTYIIDFCRDTLETNPMVGCAATTILVLPALLLVPETLGKKLT